ncbi:MAG: hypothetical protein U5L06_14645 [Rhodovibrio sp.]|nr:hypothetical protein [Rhodovibrio sp.]
MAPHRRGFCETALSKPAANWDRYSQQPGVTVEDKSKFIDKPDTESLSDDTLRKLIETGLIFATYASDGPEAECYNIATEIATALLTLGDQSETDVDQSAKQILVRLGNFPTVDSFLQHVEKNSDISFNIFSINRNHRNRNRIEYNGTTVFLYRFPNRIVEVSSQPGFARGYRADVSGQIFRR